MTTPTKVILGIATLMPLLYGAAVFVFLGFAFVSAFEGHPPAFMQPQGMAPPPREFFLLFVAHFVMTFWVLGLLIFYIRHVFVTDRIPSDRKLLWVVVLFLGNLLAMCIYWFVYVWREAPLAAPAT